MMKIDPRLISSLKIFVSIVFFIGCSTFVAVRGYKCFTKYLTKPQSNRISYRFNSHVTFPTISFCPKEEPGVHIEELHKCQLSQDDYFKNGQWTGKVQNSNCSDPKILHNNLMPNLNDLEIEKLSIKTFKQKLEFNTTLAMEFLQWTSINLELESMACFELKIPENIRSEGISEVKIQANYKKVFLYQEGWFNSESPELMYNDTSNLIVSHEIVHLLDYDSKPCIEDDNYKNHICRHEVIYKVHIFKYKICIR